MEKTFKFIQTYWFYGLGALVIVAAAWTFWPKDKLEVGVAAALPEAKVVADEPKVITKIEYIKVYPKTAKPKLHLPETVVKDDAKQVTATGTLKAEERDYTISSVIDTNTGESTVYAEPKPLPWIGPGRGGRIGVAYGLKHGEIVGRLYGSHDLLQVKALHAGFMGNVDTDSEWFAGGYIEWRF